LSWRPGEIMSRQCRYSVPPILFVCVQAALLARQEYRYERRLTAGDQSTYQMQTRIEGAPGESVATVRLRAVERDGAVQEQVEWISARNGAGDLALSLAPYPLLSNPRAVLSLLPPGEDADRLGLITDLYTMFFAVSPLAGSREVRMVGDSYTRPELVSGDWSNGTTFPLGRDRLTVNIRLEALDPKRATYVTMFRPPQQGPSWPMHRPWMEPPVCGTTGNNFQMVRRQGAQFLALWGCEEFTIRTDVERTTGRTLDAVMDNRLDWRIRVCPDEALTRCVDAPNLTRQRHVSLQLQ